MPYTLPEPAQLIEIAFRIGATLAVALVLQRLLFLVVGRLERFIGRRGHGTHQSLQRARTLAQIMRSLVTTVVVVAAAIHLLQILGWDVKPLIAGAGIVGVAVGFGSQSLVRDMIAGVFILIENQYSVGDLIEINGQPATVEELTVRSTVLRDFNGYVHFVPNGEMRVVTNRSRDWNRIPVDVVITDQQNLDRAMEVCRRVLTEFNADPAWRERLLDPAELWGVESVTGHEATVRTVLRARPGAVAQQAARELRGRLYSALADTGIGTRRGADTGGAPPPAQPPAPAA